MSRKDASLARFSELYQTSFKGVFRFFYYKSVNFNSIEELCQEVYLRFWKNYTSKLGDADQCKKILYGICLNVYREWVRSQISSQFVSLESYWEQLMDEDSLSSTQNWEDEKYEEHLGELKNRLRTAIAKLSPRLREVVELKYLQGLTRRQTSEQMGLTEDQVHTYQKRAVKALKDLVHQETGEPVPPNALNL